MTTCPALTWWETGDERLAPRLPALLHALRLQLLQLHQLELSSCWGSCRGSSREQFGVWKDRRDQAPALPLKGKGLGQVTVL